MNYWVLADTHFGHERMHEECERPEDFEDKILSHVRTTVRPGDVVIHLGDFCIGNDAKWHTIFMGACSGKKWLLKGNHDRKSMGWYLAHGWDCVADDMTLTMFGKTIILSHFPIVNAFVGIDWVNVHGHHHNTRHHPEDAVTERHRLVFLEHEYAPVKLQRIIEGRHPHEPL